MFDLQSNKEASKLQVDLAGEAVYYGQQHDATVFFQAAPFWQERWPGLHIWDCDVLRPFVRDGTWGDWCKMARDAYNAVTGAVARLAGPMLNMPKYTLGNWFLQNRVYTHHLAPSMFTCCACKQHVHIACSQCGNK